MQNVEKIQHKPANNAGFKKHCRLVGEDLPEIIQPRFHVQAIRFFIQQAT